MSRYEELWVCTMCMGQDDAYFPAGKARGHFRDNAAGAVWIEPRVMCRVWGEITFRIYIYIYEGSEGLDAGVEPLISLALLIYCNTSSETYPLQSNNSTHIYTIMYIYTLYPVRSSAYSVYACAMVYAFLHLPRYKRRQNARSIALEIHW